MVAEVEESLLDAVNHASTEQRSAVDALVATSADLLERVGTRFTDHVEAETGKLGVVAAQVTGSAAEVASLGEAFGVAVQVFGESNDKLVAHLQRIESALDKSLARSDEQLAYYVAQAREVIDLSIARTVAQLAHATRAIGTAGYMAPEQREPQRLGPPTPATDLWGMGATLYHAAAGRPPFSETEALEAPDPLPKSVGASLATLIAACLDPDPAARPTPAEAAAEHAAGSP